MFRNFSIYHCDIDTEFVWRVMGKREDGHVVSVLLNSQCHKLWELWKDEWPSSQVWLKISPRGTPDFFPVLYSCLAYFFPKQL